MEGNVRIVFFVCQQYKARKNLLSGSQILDSKKKRQGRAGGIIYFYIIICTYFQLESSVTRVMQEVCFLWLIINFHP